MKILVTGSKGMLAHDLIPVLGERHEVIAPPEIEFDVTQRASSYEFAKKTSPHVIINCAAYTNVDKAEEERGKAFMVNGTGVQNLALICHEMDIPLCHISTDYVFDGTKPGSYTPFDTANPINVYGESKLAGEKYIEWIMNEFYIMRTSWLYGGHGSNFVATILRLAGERPELKVVDDQRGSPTSTVTLSLALRALVESGAYGIYHFTDETRGGISWFDFANEIIRISGYHTKAIPIPTSEFPRPAKRPMNSVLDTSVFSTVTGHAPVDWKEALKEHLR